MSNPNEAPQPQQPGAQPQQPGNVPPAGYQPPQEYQAPPSYQAPPAYQQPAPGYQQQGQPGHQQQGQPGHGEGFRFEMPTDGPKSFNDVLPQGGFSGMFKVAGMPTELKVSYWIWLIGGLLGLLGGLFGLFGSFVLFTLAPEIAVGVLLLVLIALVMAAAQIVFAMKMKEGKEWARLALTVIAGISLILSIAAGAIANGQGNNWFGFVISVVATVLMWLPNSQAWFKSAKGAV